MIDLHYKAQQIHPSQIASYIDVIRVWIKVPLTRAERKWLRHECRNKKLKVLNEAAWFDGTYLQRLRLHQPSRAALEFLSRRRDTHISYAEVSLDWVFEYESEKEDAWEFACKYLVKRHHRKQGIRFVHGVTRYSGPRRAPNVIALYADRASKVTGDENCVHFDWRIKGSQALRRAGIGQIADLLAINPRNFWLERLIFRGVGATDICRLGRAHCNWVRKTKRRARWVIKGPGDFEYDVDRRVGGLILRSLQSSQAVIDEYGSRFDAGRFFWTMNDTHLLPGSHLDFP